MPNVEPSSTKKHWAHHGVTVEHPGRFSPALVRLAGIFIEPLTRLLFRPSITGFENLPEGKPYLLVTNHSAGLGLAEIGSFS